MQQRRLCRHPGMEHPVTKPQTEAPAPDERVPLGQRLYDNWLVLLIAGVLIMAAIYTGWGLFEIATMPTGRLP